MNVWINVYKCIYYCEIDVNFLGNEPTHEYRKIIIDTSLNYYFFP